MGQQEPAACSDSGSYLQESGKQSFVMPKVFLFCDEQSKPKSDSLRYGSCVQRRMFRTDIKMLLGAYVCGETAWDPFAFCPEGTCNLPL